MRNRVELPNCLYTHSMRFFSVSPCSPIVAMELVSTHRCTFFLSFNLIFLYFAPSEAIPFLTGSSPFSSLISSIRQPFQIIRFPEVDPSNAKTVLGATAALLTRSASGTASDLAVLRTAIAEAGKSTLRGGAIQAVSASDALSNVVADKAERAIHKSQAVEYLIAQAALSAMQRVEASKKPPFVLV